MNLPENLKKKRDELAEINANKFYHAQGDIHQVMPWSDCKESFQQGFDDACAELFPMIEKLEFKVYYAMKYLDSTGINNEKYEHEPEYMMLMGFKEVLAELKKWRES